MRRLFLVAAVLSAMFVATFGVGTTPRSADAAGGTAYIVHGTQWTTFKFAVNGLMPNDTLTAWYVQGGSNQQIQISGAFYSGPDGATGLSFVPYTDFLAPVSNGNYKIYVCDSVNNCVGFDITIGEQAYIFSSSVSTNPCAYTPQFVPSGVMGPVVYFGNTVLPADQAYWQAVACGLPAWSYSWAPSWVTNFSGYWGQNYLGYIDPALLYYNPSVYGAYGNPNQYYYNNGFYYMPQPMGGVTQPNGLYNPLNPYDMPNGPWIATLLGR